MYQLRWDYYVRSRLVAASAITLAAALAGCSGSDSDGGTSAAPSGEASKSAAPSSSKASKDSSSKAPSSSSSAPSSSAAPSSSQAPSSSDAPAAGAPGKTVNENQLVAMSKKVGCTKPAFQKASPSSPAAKVGTKGGVNCQVGTDGYIFALVKPGTGAKATALKLKQTAKTKAPVPYLHGDNWALFAVKGANGKAPQISEPLVKDAQSKIGAGEIAKS